MNNFFGKNLRYLREKKDVDQLELANLLGRKSASSISEWEKGTYTPKSGVLSDIARIFNVNLQDLMNTDLSKPQATNLIEVNQRTIRIPVLGEIACGVPILAEENYEDYRTTLAESLPAGNIIYLRARGDSMHPTIPDGAMIMVREQPEVEQGEIAAVMVDGSTRATLKRVKMQGDMMILMPDNPAHEPIFVTKDYPVQIIGKAVRMETDF